MVEWCQFRYTLPKLLLYKCWKEREKKKEAENEACPLKNS